MRPGSEIPPGVLSDPVFTSTVMIAGYAEVDDGDVFVWSCGMSWVGGRRCRRFLVPPPASLGFR